MKENKIKILFLINRLSVGGAERLAVSIAKGVSGNDFEPVFVTLYDAQNYKKELKEKKIKLYELKRKSWHDIQAFFTLRKIIKKEKVDIINTFLLPSDIWGGLASWGLSIKKISSILNLGFSDGKKDRLRPYISKMFNLLIACGGVVKERLVNFHKISESKINVIYNGIDIEKFKNSFKVYDKEAPVLGMLARLEKVKGHAYLLEACGNLAKQGYDFRIVFVGDGKEKDNLAKKALKHGLKDRVSFRGSKSDMPKELKSIDILVAPSLSEGFSLTLVEGMASGKIVVSSNVGGAQEVIKNRENGFIFESENTKELEEVLENIFNNSNIVEDLQKSATKTAQKFETKIMIDNYKKTYNKVLAK